MANVITAGVGSAFQVLASAARTATPDTQEFELPRGTSFLTLVTDATAITDTPSVTVTVSGVDRVSGKIYTLLAGAAITGVSTQVLKIGPGLPVTANVSANEWVPPVIRITATHGDTDSITYSIGAMVG